MWSVVDGREDPVDEVANALSVAPQGKWLAGLLRIGQLVFARGLVRLTGYVFESEQRAPGLMLSLLSPSGSVVDNTTIWAIEYEPLTRSGDVAPDNRCDRLLRLATVGPVVDALHFHESPPRATRRGLCADTRYA